ncbi:MAG: bacteriohemerythrin [bacterium]|nr:bacteriohemerythrin [bacterium]
MPLIEWTEEFSVGIEEIDNQHQKWISIVNELHDSIIKTRGISALKELIREMEEYTDLHFSTEEEMLEKAEWPELDRHKRIHFSFKQQVMQLKRDIYAGELVLRSQVMSVIKNWLVEHILKEDREYSKFIKNKT